MLERLHLDNFRGFGDHTVPFNELTVMVGANNAGKSTAVEALRLIALVVTRFRRGATQFVAVPDWLDHPAAYRGITPTIRGRASDLEGHGASTFHRYNDPPAILTAHFKGGASVSVFVGPAGEIFGVVRDRNGNAVGTAADARRLGLPAMAIQPQVAPLQRDERLLTEETVRRGEATYLAPQHFRNQLLLFHDAYPTFCELAETTWPGLQILDLATDPLHPNEPLGLIVRDDDFVGEVSLMGHGLQMWLQTIWFLARVSARTTVILDEPDVYLHPDLQRRLIDVVRDRFDQLVVATHSIEIITDVDLMAILSIDRRRSRSRFVTSLPGLQAVIDGLGAAHNIQVTRLVRSRSFLLIEGDDIRLLRNLQRVVAPQAEPIDLVPHVALGGRGGWASGLPASLPSRNAEGRRIRSYCILDRDYFPDEEVRDRYQEAVRWNVSLRIWKRKELENYLLVPAAISRYIRDHAARGVVPPDAAAVTRRIDRIIEGMRDTPITESYTTYLYVRNRAGGIPNAMRQARALVAAGWATREGRWAIAPGKEVISALSRWSKQRFGVSFGADQLSRTVMPDEVDDEVREVLQAIGDRRPLPPP